MPDDHAAFDLNEFESFVADQTRWATLDVTIQEIAANNQSLVQDISSYDPQATIPLLASLLTVPEYQSQCIRLEILVALAIVYCKGSRKASIGKVMRWFEKIGKSQCVIGEDPAEDVFVSLVHDNNGNYRLLEGTWEAAGFYTQRIVEVISTMPDDERFGRIKDSLRALLVISDLVCEKAGLRRYQLGSDERHETLSKQKIPKRNTLIARVAIAFEELNARGINPAEIEPFLFHPGMIDGLAEQQFGSSYLERYPLIAYSETHFTVALPTALSVAARDFVIANIIDGGLLESFDHVLADNYAELLSKTPLLGGPMRAPVLWEQLGAHRLSNFSFEIDQGYFISYHSFLPSVETHIVGGFKTLYEDEGALTQALQKSIDNVMEKISVRSGFKSGLIVIVGCGWGKGSVTGGFEMNHSKWRIQMLSAADLIRLSWLDDMTPGYFWRIQDGLETVTASGVHFVNPNGIMNLIAWVRSNAGHFIPHAQLQHDDISPEQPFMVQPPQNLIRDVRVDADLGYDRHRAIDNTGTWHDVQHESPKPFFSSESSRRLYASMDHAHSGILTSVYEGALQLWLTLDAPKIVERDVKYRLWSMANEWLHRIGNVLDERAEHVSQATQFKVYVEFQDVDQPEENGGKPSAEDLVQLCLVDHYNEPNASKAVFQPGFLSGFSIAENTAERLFVLNLARAFLQLLDVADVDREAEVITGRVVLNEDARSFHLFHAQHFIDFVRDTLPKELVVIDPIDDAAAKIGLGLRVIDRSQSRHIVGRQACTNFLRKVVDALLADIFDLLRSFERTSTLIRLVANGEKADAEANHWMRTSAAIIGLYGDNNDTIRRYVEQTSIFTGAGIASRVLTEIALCLCPVEQGAQISDIELSKLIARASLLIRLGGFSDAIHYNALVPEVAISPLGDILFRDDFGDLVVQPMLSRAIGDKFIANAPFQKKNYEDPGFITTIRNKVSDEFWRIWKNEMGFDLDEARQIIGALEDKGIRDHAAIFLVKQSEYFSSVCSEQVTEKVAIRFLEQFSLTQRARWDKPPNGFEAKDIYPWRLGRRLSFVARPILRVNASDDPQLIIAPASLRKGFALVFDGAYSGRLEQSFFQTEEMRNVWWGKASEGHSFNAEVARRLSETGWEIRENIGLPELLNRKTECNFGDVDVLAWKRSRREVLVIECKDLSPARNYSEISALLSGYQGVDKNGVADSLKKHLNRVSVVENNLDELQRFTGTREPSVISCLVCSGIVPMQYAKIEALAKTHVGMIEDVLAL